MIFSHPATCRPKVDAGGHQRADCARRAVDFARRASPRRRKTGHLRMARIGCAPPRRDSALDLHLVFPDGILGSDFDLLISNQPPRLCPPVSPSPTRRRQRPPASRRGRQLVCLVVHRSASFMVGLGRDSNAPGHGKPSPKRRRSKVVGCEHVHRKRTPFAADRGGAPPVHRTGGTGQACPSKLSVPPAAGAPRGRGRTSDGICATAALYLGATRNTVL